MEINLFVNLYDDPERMPEFEECLHRNSQLMRVHVVRQQQRPTFEQMFSKFRDDAINIVANADIYFNETQWFVGLRNDECWALTRYDAYSGEFMNRRDSQDSFCFKGKIKPGNYDFTIGIGGCDNRLCFELQQAGYIVRNPSLTVKTFHMHKEEKRTWHGMPQVPGPYLLLYPESI